MTFYQILMVFLGAIPGAGIRWALGYFQWSIPLPYLSTSPSFIPNVLGCFLLGAFVGKGLEKDMMLFSFFAIGLCGSLTTFSSLIYEVFLKIRVIDHSAQVSGFLFIILIHLAGGLLSFSAGHWLIRRIICHQS